MSRPLTLVLYMAIMTWLLLLAASLIRARGWTPPGMKVAMGNRDDLPEATPLAGRADRTARNTMEGFVLFAAIALVAHASGSTNPHIGTGAELFFWARVLYVPIYYAGIPVVRTGVWLAGVAGLAMMLLPLL